MEKFDTLTPEGGPNEALRFISNAFENRAKILRAVALLGVIALPNAVKAEDAQGQNLQTLTKVESVSNAAETSVTLDNGTVLMFPSLEDIATDRDVYMPAEGNPDSVVVFIKQIHAVPSSQTFYTENSVETKLEALDIVTESQRVQYELLQALVEAGTIKTVCAEGYPQELIDNGFLDKLTVVYDRFITQDLGKYYGAEHTLTAEELEEHRLYLGGELNLAMEGEITLCGAESTEFLRLEAANYQGVDSAIKQDPARLKEFAYELREDGALAQIASLSEPAVAVTYGDAHDFTDAVERWNAAHPDNQMGLLVYTPEVNAAYGNLDIQ